MSIEETIKDLSNGIDNIADSLNPINDFGNNVGDELHQIEWQLSRIADALEVIVKKMPQ